MPEKRQNSTLIKGRQKIYSLNKNNIHTVQHSTKNCKHVKMLNSFVLKTSGKRNTYIPLPLEM